MKSIRQIVASLSGGQRQTVAIARAVLWNSKLVILDEPTAALGVAQTDQVLKLVRRLADRGLAVLLISHNMNDVFAVADSIAVLYLGQLVAQVPASSVTTNQVVELITTAARRRGSASPSAQPTWFRDEQSATARPRRRDHVMTAVETDQAAPLEVTEIPPKGIADSVSDYFAKVRGGDVGSLPAVLGLIALVVVFSALRPDTFTTALNFANLINQGAAVIVIVDGPRLRPAARRDRPVGRLHRGHVRRDHGRQPDEPRLAVDRGRDRSASPPARVIGLSIGLLVTRLGHPVVRRDAGLLPRPAGRHARRSSARAARSRSTTGSSWRSTTTTCPFWLELGCCAPLLVVGVRRPEPRPDPAAPQDRPVDGEPRRCGPASPWPWRCCSASPRPT